MKRAADKLVAHAQSDAERARADLFATITEMRRRLDPRVVVAEAAEGAVGQANYLLAEAGSGVKNRPLVSLGGVAAFVIAVSLRLWLARRSRNSDAT